MTINELRGIIVECGVRGGDTFCVGGCDLLERINDVPGFVSLLREFKKRGISFVDNYPDPIGLILGGGVKFSIVDISVVRDLICIYVDDTSIYSHWEIYDDD